MEPSDEQPSVLGSVLRSGDRVQIANLRRRWDLNTRGGTLVRWLPEAGRWQTKPDNIDTHISVSPENLIGIPCMMRDVETLIAQWQRERPSTQSLDAEFLGIGARHGAAVLMDPSLQPLLEHVARQRQKTLYKWGTVPHNPEACVNTAIAPTLALALQAVAWRPTEEGPIRIHCIGATDDFEGREDWSRLPALLHSAGVSVPRRCEILHVGTMAGFSMDVAAEMFEGLPPPFRSKKVKVHKSRGLYHKLSGCRSAHVAILCHPGFEAYTEDWYPTMAKLIQESTITIVTGHSNATTFTHDAANLQASLQAFGANVIQSCAWNPFCQVYTDETKGSLLAPLEMQSVHASMAAFAVFSWRVCENIPRSRFELGAAELSRHGHHTGSCHACKGSLVWAFGAAVHVPTHARRSAKGRPESHA